MNVSNFGVDNDFTTILVFNVRGVLNLEERVFPFFDRILGVLVEGLTIGLGIPDVLFPLSRWLLLRIVEFVSLEAS